MRRLTLLALLLVVAPAAAQENTRKELRESQLRLEQIRLERSKLEDEMNQLKSRVRDSSRELANIEKQRIASINALREVEFQSDVLSKTVDETSTQRGQTEAKLAERQASLAERLRSMYKRGDMHATRVLLTAESFGDLLQRYKYLRMIALYERAVIDDGNLVCSGGGRVHGMMRRHRPDPGDARCAAHLGHHTSRVEIEDHDAACVHVTDVEAALPGIHALIVEPVGRAGQRNLGNDCQRATRRAR